MSAARDVTHPSLPRPQRRPQYGSDVIVDMLQTCGIVYAACNPGASFRGLHDSIVNYGGNAMPELIQCCHEEISVAIAHGYAKATGTPMAALLHNIVGLQHASMALFNAWCDRAPVLALGATGPMDSTQRRPWIDWIHTALVQGTLVRDYVKWDDQPHSLASVPESFLRAYRIAQTDPQGPIYVCYDAGLQEEVVRVPPTLPTPQRYAPSAPPQAHPEALERTADLLVQAEHPVAIVDLVGRHPAAIESLRSLAELLAMPVIDRGGRFNFPNTHGLDATDSGSDVLANADVVLALDVLDLFGALGSVDRATRMFQPSIGPQTQIIHITMGDFLVHSWAADYERLQAVDLPIAADTAVALPHLLALCQARLGSADVTRLTARAAHLRTQHWARRQQWQQAAHLARAQRHSGKVCVNLQADGDLLYTPSALWTAAHHHIPLLVVMFNNRSYYNSEEHALELARVRERPLANAGIGTRLDDPPVNFAHLAQAFGLYGAGPIETPDAIRPALERALRVVKDEGRLALVDIVMQPR